ncbi:MAG: bifunctional diguanylate cyclase/phosphodiesterase [Cryobacterium sp.]
MSESSPRRERARLRARAAKRSWYLATQPGRLVGRYRRGELDLSFHPGVLDSPAAAGTLIAVIALLGSTVIGIAAIFPVPPGQNDESRGYAATAVVLCLFAVSALTLRHRVTRPIRHLAIILIGLFLQVLILQAPEITTAVIYAQGSIVVILLAYTLLPARQSLLYPPLCLVVTFTSVAVHPGLSARELVIAGVITLTWLTGLHWIVMSALTSETDALTRVDNLRGFKRSLGARLNNDAGCSVTIVVMDLDHFAVTNETVPTDDADQMLVTFAVQCSELLPGRAMVARIGGDEFGLILPDCPTDDAVGLLNTLRPLVHGFSAGIAASEAGESESEMITHAQDALHVAKRSGRGVTRVHGGHYAGPAVVTQAIAAGEFFLEYQPVVDLRTRRVVGAEALVRWQHPTRGRISPEEFIPLCESSGSIVPLGQWVLTQAVLTAATWRVPSEPGRPDFFISVNASGQEFANPHYAAHAVEACRKADVAPRTLTIELTESDYGIDADVVYDNLRRLQQAGIPVAIDDFGTGFASLERLSRMNADTLKIDRRFVADIHASEDDAPLVQMIIGLAAALSNEVIAEGIETEAQALWLEEHDCQLGQGYLFSRPVRAEAFLGACAAIPEPLQT